ncbi:hypothetical protein P261_00192 [Lachnospiraceae bacterium TWA4]|nr:hypothetical protein P261_00192 [Lachnospiraceae bacterium TWA4]
MMNLYDKEEIAKAHDNRVFEEGKEAGMAQGIAQGMAQALNGTIFRMYENHQTLEAIANAVGYSIDQVKSVLKTKELI